MHGKVRRIALRSASSDGFGGSGGWRHVVEEAIKVYLDWPEVIRNQILVVTASRRDDKSVQSQVLMCYLNK